MYRENLKVMGPSTPTWPANSRGMRRRSHASSPTPLPGHASGPMPPPIGCRRTCETASECGTGRVVIQAATGWQCFANSTIQNPGPTVERPATATSLPCANVTTGSNPKAIGIIDNPSRGPSSPSHRQAKPTSPGRTHHQHHPWTIHHRFNRAARTEKMPSRR